MQTAYLTHWFLDNRYPDNSQNNTGSAHAKKKGSRAYCPKGCLPVAQDAGEGHVAVEGLSRDAVHLVSGRVVLDEVSLVGLDSDGVLEGLGLIPLNVLGEARSLGQARPEQRSR